MGVHKFANTYLAMDLCKNTPKFYYYYYYY